MCQKGLQCCLALGWISLQAAVVLMMRLQQGDILERVPKGSHWSRNRLQTVHQVGDGLLDVLTKRIFYV